jgi:hypothetical protein
MDDLSLICHIFSFFASSHQNVNASDFVLFFFVDAHPFLLTNSFPSLGKKRILMAKLKPKGLTLTARSVQAVAKKAQAVLGPEKEDSVAK